MNSDDSPSSKLESNDGLRWRISKWFPDLGDDKTLKLKAFYSELIFFNGRMNLISPKTEVEGDQIHIADAVLASRVIFNDCTEKKIFDLGSGNGVPGIVMAILEPKRTVVLVDADGRKIEFLKHCIARLQLPNCSTIHGRLEDLEENSVNCGVTRAMASISKMLLFSRKAAATGASLYHLKGESWPREIAEIPSQILAHWVPTLVSEYKLPESGAQLAVVLTKRHKK